MMYHPMQVFIHPIPVYHGHKINFPEQYETLIDHGLVHSIENKLIHM